MNKTIKYKKENSGRLYYRRLVPLRHQKTIGLRVWNRPCGDVSYQDAVVMITEWAKSDDALIAALDNPDTAVQVRQRTEAKAMAPKVSTMINLQISDDLPDAFDPLEAAIAGLKNADQNPDFDNQDRLVRYRAILKASFGAHIKVPNDPDERDMFELVKRKLERRIADIAGDPNTLSSVSVKYFAFKQIKPMVQGKYRRNIQKLIDHVGDIPIGHLSSKMLREFRDAQFATMNAASLHSVFTPIKGMLRYAIQEEIISDNPLSAVDLQVDKRPISQRKWKPFTPSEAQRIFDAMERYWGEPLRGISDSRRMAVWWAVRVQAFTAMRPKEVVWLEPRHVTDEWIRIEDSKTVGSERVIPLHPELREFPNFIHKGGFDVFKSQSKDRVQSVRHNFYRLTRDFMDPPITDPKKVLYSWRSSFSNAMRRAGADAEMRRAILGHAEAGALRHYDDGPEFAKKRKWIRATDCRTVYPDPSDDDDDLN